MSFENPALGNSALVAAIDLGTAASGYASSLRHEFVKDPLHIHISFWTGELCSFKTPSVVLLKPNKTFHAFGYEAEDTYASLTEDNEHEGWLYFKRFKINLQNKSLRRTTMIKDVNGKEMPAMTIFTMAMKYLKDRLKGTLKWSKIIEDITIWVLTVPAIWDEGAKQFMTEAAAEAGIPRKQLWLVSEPEAAFFYCNHISRKAMSDGKGGTETDLLEPGTRCMVLDLGVTTDITVLEVQSNRTLREVHHATSGAWGGTKVDHAFYQFLVKLFGNDVLTKLKDENMDEYISFLREFEKKKRNFIPDSDKKVTIVFPVVLQTIFEEQTGETLAEALQQTTYAQTVEVRTDKLRMHRGIFKEFFSHTLQGIIQHIKDIMQSFQGESVSKILLVGGFSESPMVLKAIRELFPNKKVIAPADPGLAVLKGAVLFGHTPNTASCTLSRAVSSGIGM